MTPAPLDQFALPVSMFVGPQPLTPSAWPPIRDVQYGYTQTTLTTWRQLLLASASAGRPLKPHLARFGNFAVAELRVRINSLVSGLQLGRDRANNTVVTRSPWLLNGSDPSEAAAIGYRIGMAAAHLICVHKLGLADTGHVSLLPRGDSRHGRRGRNADLHGLHPTAPHDWLIEAKGTSGVCRVTTKRRQQAAHQLDAARATRAYTHPHVQALVSAACNPLLHVMVELGLPPGTSTPTAWLHPESWHDPVFAGVTAQTRLLQRALIGTALRQADPRFVELENGPAAILDIPGTDVSVGLMLPAYKTFNTHLTLLDDAGVSFTTLRARHLTGLAIREREPQQQPAEFDAETAEPEVDIRRSDPTPDGERIRHTDGEQARIVDPGSSDGSAHGSRAEASGATRRKTWTTVTVEGQGGISAAVDQAGRVVVLGPGWRERG